MKCENVRKQHEGIFMHFALTYRYPCRNGKILYDDSIKFHLWGEVLFLFSCQFLVKFSCRRRQIVKNAFIKIQQKTWQLLQLKIFSLFLFKWSFMRVKMMTNFQKSWKVLSWNLHKCLLCKRSHLNGNLLCHAVKVVNIEVISCLNN